MNPENPQPDLVERIIELETNIVDCKSDIENLHAYLETVEKENKTLKEIGAEYWQTLCHYDHDGISTPWPYSTGGNRQSSAIEQLKSSVPFDVLQKECTKYKCKYWCDARGCFCDIKRNCPLIPKGE
jgi:hypothetical protein